MRATKTWTATKAWDVTNKNLAPLVGKTFRNGAYKLVAIAEDGLVVEWTATGKQAKVWRTLIEKTWARMERGEEIRERSISYTVVIEYFVREALAETVVVVSCAAEKAPVAEAAAKDLYASSTFKMARRFAETHGDRWAILSALHGLLSPETLVKTYDMALPEQPKAYRAAWAQAVAEQLEAAAAAVRSARVAIRTRFVLVAGSAYRAAFEALQVFGSSPVQWECPVAGMMIGEMRAWLGAAVKA